MRESYVEVRLADLPEVASTFTRIGAEFERLGSEAERMANYLAYIASEGHPVPEPILKIAENWRNR